jgi:hypothetical protein
VAVVTFCRPWWARQARPAARRGSANDAPRRQVAQFRPSQRRYLRYQQGSRDCLRIPWAMRGPDPSTTSDLLVAWRAVHRGPWATGKSGSKRFGEPLARPDGVRTRHLPPPAKTARALGVPGLAGRLSGVPLWVMMCRRAPLHCSGCGRMTDGIMPEPAVCRTAGSSGCTHDGWDLSGGPTEVVVSRLHRVCC